MRNYQSKTEKAKLISRIHTKGDALTSICEEVETFDSRVKDIIDDMTKVLKATKRGVGLASNQLGYCRRIIVIRPNRTKMIAMINPDIIYRSTSETTEIESCLSYPGASKKVSRSDDITVIWDNSDGVSISWRTKGMTARIIQHEIDHLNGKCKLA